MKQKKLKITLLNSLKLTFRLRLILPVISLGLLLYLFLFFNVGTPKIAKAGTETLSSGSFIINMGVTPQTYNNGIKPYGMIYDMIVNYNVPVKWVIDQSKSKDGTDFIHSGTSYKGGPFIIPAEYINSTISSRITYWQSQGISGSYTTGSISVPVYSTLTNFPKIIIDTVSGNEGIITNYFDNALIPSTAYVLGSPSFLTNCHDLWINPHGEPDWTTHGYLYNLVTIAHSYVWEQCHAVSVTEGVKNPSSPFQQLNFLTSNGLKCYGSSKCGATITETHTGNPTSPYTYFYPTDPVMQFMSTMDGVASSGSEKWYQPQSTGSWRSTTKRLVTTATGTSPKEGVLMVYGPAFGDTTNGYVMYEGGHDLDGAGSTTEKVAAQRAFFNFVLLAGYKKQLNISNVVTPSTMYSLESKPVSLSVNGGTPGYTYTWSSSIGGTFTNNRNASTTFRAPSVNSTTSGVITCNVLDNCSRQNFISRPVIIYTNLPISLKSFNGNFKEGRVELNWIVASEVNNDYYTIERSSDGINYMDIGNVNGSKNIVTDKRYDFIDYSPNEGKNYYRLRQTDIDGNTKSFDPIFVKVFPYNGVKNKATFLPNPFIDKLIIDYYSEDAVHIDFNLMDRSGNIVRNQSIFCKQGMNNFQFNDLGELFPGIYYAVFIRDDEREVIKLLKY